MTEVHDCELISRSKVDELSGKATYWFEKHNEAQEEVSELEITCEIQKSKIESLEKEVHYWINAYQEEVQKKGRSNE